MSNIKQTNITHYVLSALQTLYQWKDFLGCAEPMLPMCQLKVKVTVKGQILDIMSCPLYKPYIPMEGLPSNLNDTFTSTRGCAEPMLFMCQLKVKVTVKGQILNKQILHIMLCQLYNSFTNGRIFFKLEWHIHLTRGCAEPMLSMCQLKVKVTVKCQILNKQILDFTSPSWGECVIQV